ncbi:methyl-accepting chemotaxis protein [Pelagicoccus albus]|uniref:Methyl-accepting chemotaxis protein n=1 Tax=Pelagicoccus albus TaxID=415222 RepID=A0A7X1B6S2_9BACT|nr:methyl-accepting chemotaxis protein [Pelagicoccus albus]MBC2606429.1 hypothetical protein [Pelagicoccus albus]
MTDKLLEQGRAITSHQDSGEKSGIFDQALELVTSSIDFAVTSSASNTRLVEAFTRYSEQYNIVKKGEAQLAKTVVPLQIIERLFRIEASNLPQELQSSFDSLSKEIASLHGEMRLILDDQFAALRATGQKITSAKSQLSEHSRQLSELVAKTRVEIDSTLVNIRENIELNQLRNQKLLEITHKISVQNEQVMVGLQQQDFMNQRCQHVIQGINRIIEGLNDKNGLLNQTGLNAIAPLLFVESKQLQSIQTELDGAYASIEQGFQNTSDLLEGFGEKQLSHVNLEETKNSITVVVDSLLQAIEQANHLAKTAGEGTSAISQAVDSFSGTASDVTRNLFTIASGIKLIALNAQIQAAKMGEGTGLEVLSGRTCELSSETETHTRQIGSELENLSSLLESVISECSSLQSASAQKSGFLQAKGDKIREGLSGYRRQTSESLNAFSQSLKDSYQNAKRMVVASKLPRAPQETISLIRAKLEEAELCLPQRLGSLKPSGISHTVQHNYTMESERKVHEEALKIFENRELKNLQGLNPATPPGDLQTSFAASNNIELF